MSATSPAPDLVLTGPGLILLLFAGLLLLRVFFGRRRASLAGVMLFAMCILLCVGLVGAYFFIGSLRVSETRTVQEGINTYPLITLPAQAGPGTVGESVSGTTLTETATPSRAEVSGEILIEIAAATTEENSPSSRPYWVDKTTERLGGDTYVTVSVGPYSNRELCDKELPSELRRATESFIDTLLGPGAGAQVKLPMDYIQQTLRQNEEWEEPVQTSFLEMKKLHTRLKFDDRARSYIKQMHAQAVAQSRLEQAGAAGGLLLALIGTLFGYLKLDTLSKGYYSGRLKLAAGAVILAVLAASGLLIRAYD